MAWVKQGRRLAPDGITCIYEYEPPKPTKIRMVDQRNAVVVEHGDEGGGHEVVAEIDRLDRAEDKPS